MKDGLGYGDFVACRDRVVGRSHQKLLEVFHPTKKEITGICAVICIDYLSEVADRSHCLIHGLPRLAQA